MSKTIYIIEVPEDHEIEVGEYEATVSIMGIPKEVYVYNTYEGAEGHAKDFEPEYDVEAGDRYAVVHKTGGHSEISEEHTCVINGEVIWRIRGYELWEGLTKVTAPKDPA